MELCRYDQHILNFDEWSEVNIHSRDLYIKAWRENYYPCPLDFHEGNVEVSYWHINNLRLVRSYDI